jgi:hypothetical protein
MTDDEIQKILEPVRTQINPLMGGPVMIKTIEPTHHGFTPINYRLVTELSTAVLRSQMKALRRLDLSPDKELTINVSDSQGTSVITISLVDSGRT